MPIDWKLDTIADQLVAVAELFKANEPTIIEGKTFRNCTFIGPANVFLSGTVKIDGVNFKDCDFVCVKIPVRIATAIMIRNVTFIGCRFHRLLIMLIQKCRRNYPKIASLPKCRICHRLSRRSQASEALQTHPDGRPKVLRERCNGQPIWLFGGQG